MCSSTFLREAAEEDPPLLWGMERGGEVAAVLPGPFRLALFQGSFHAGDEGLEGRGQGQQAFIPRQFVDLVGPLGVRPFPFPRIPVPKAA